MEEDEEEEDCYVKEILNVYAVNIKRYTARNK